MADENKCLLKQDWSSASKAVQDWWKNNCGKVADAALQLAGHPDAGQDFAGIVDILHWQTTPSSDAQDGVNTRPGDIKDRAGWGYAGILSNDPAMHKILDFGAQLNSAKSDAFNASAAEGLGVPAAKMIAADQKSLRANLEASKDIKQILSYADNMEVAAKLAIPRVEVVRDLANMLPSQYKQYADANPESLANIGWTDWYQGSKDVFGTFADLKLQADALIEALKVIQTAAAEVRELYEDLEKTQEKAEKTAAAALQEHLDKCMTRAQPAQMGLNRRVPGTETKSELRADVPECQGDKLKDWQKIRGDLQQELDALKAAREAGLEAFLEQGGDVIPEAFVGQTMKRTFKEQCLLLSNVYKIAQYKQGALEKAKPARLPYVNNSSGSYNACLMAQRSPWGFMNQLVQDPSYGSFFDISPSLLSQLSPMIRLYKIEMDANTQGERQVEIKFDTHYNASALDNIFNNKDKRGFGVGLKSFNFSYEGSNPFAVKKSIKAKLVIFASSFDDLLAQRGQGLGAFRYCDLALKTGGNLNELLDRSDKSASAIVNNISKLNFRLKVVVGWAMPNGNFENNTPIPQEDRTNLAKAIDNSFVTLNLTPTIHNFDIDDQGRVVFSIEYLAYIEDFFDQPNYDIFASPKNYAAALKRKLMIASVEEHCEADLASQKKKEIYEKVEEEKRANLSTILSQLLKTEKIYFVPIKLEKLAEFNKQGPFFDFSLDSSTPTVAGSNDEITKGFAAALAKLQKQTELTTDLSQTKIEALNETTYIKFFYLSDLVNVVLHNIETSLTSLVKTTEGSAGPNSLTFPTGLTKTPAAETSWKALVESEKERLQRLLFNFKHFRVLLGPCELYDFSTGQGKRRNESSLMTTVNLGDLPISVSYFMDWLTEKVLKRESPIYTLSTFMNDLLNGLVRNFLNEDRCHDLNIKQKTRMFQSVVTSYKNWKVKGKTDTTNQDEITNWIIRQPKLPGQKVPASKLWMEEASWMKNYTGRNQTGILDVMGVRDSPISTRSPSMEYNYLVYYAGRVNPSSEMKGERAADTANGIWHYMIGKPNGIVKTIRLTRTDSPGLKEVRFEQEGYDGLSQLRETYDATITCYGSPNIVPGTYIYIDPRGFAPKKSTGKDEYTFEDSAGKKHTIDPALLTRYGIGGYYMVIKAENKLGPGEFNTTITAKWVAELGSNKSNLALRAPRPTKCKASQ